jgi:hypothetical protein
MNYLSVCSGELVTRRVRDITGHRNGRLVAQKLSYMRQSDQRAMWECKCDCGGTKIVAQNNLMRAAGTKSCGCLRREANAKKRRKDGAWNEGKSYSIQSGQRCYKSRQSWAKACLRAKGNKCERCGWNQAKCDVHHKIPKAQRGLNLISNSLILCPNCHRVEHELALKKKGAGVE